MGVTQEDVIKGLEGCFDALVQDEHAIAENGVVMSSWQDRAKRIDAIRKAIALLKAQEPVKPILARGWYWCGGVGCRNSLTSALDDDSPARKPNYCEKCGRAVKWDA